MDALKFIEERNRMCKSFGGNCNCCPADKDTYICCDAFDWQKELVAIVEEWSAAHPRKTRQSVFLARYPEARCLEDGTLAICPSLLYSAYRNHIGGCNHLEKHCANCRREFWTQEI